MRSLILITLILASSALSQMPPIEPGVSQELAKWRATQYSNISYKLNLTLEKMSPVLKGTIEIRVTVSEPPASAGGQKLALSSPPPIILDWRKIPGHEEDSKISNVTINGTRAIPPPRPDAPDRELGPIGFFSSFLEQDEHLIFNDELNGIRPGENVIKLDFTSPILTSGSAITRYVDKEDGAEYIYSLFVPSDASTAFPVFDQPDLKARFTLLVERPKDWVVVANTTGRDSFKAKPSKINGVDCNSCGYFYYTSFQETKPISTYVFAFAAGPFAEVSGPGAVATGFPGAKNPVAIAPGSDPVAAAQPSTHIYVRKSQAEKFKPHAAEVFRLNREGIKYLESYFDYKFPWPKYDLVLIPEFPFGGMEHAGATFLREHSVIFPQEPTKNDIISRANLIFHEAAHQWFGDTVTMKWFDDLWLKEGFAEFMAYKTLEKVMPEANAWKVFYERNKRAAYATDSTKGTTPIYQPIANLSAAKSAYGNIVYRKAPSFLRQAEFYLGEQKFQTAVRAFLKKHQFADAGWEDLVREFEAASGKNLKDWAKRWITQKGAPVIRTEAAMSSGACLTQWGSLQFEDSWGMKVRVAVERGWDDRHLDTIDMLIEPSIPERPIRTPIDKIFAQRNMSCFETSDVPNTKFAFGNYQDYGYGIFLLDDISRDYVLKNIGREKDDFLRTMMWGSLWDSVREAELDPKDYVELVIKVLGKSYAFTREPTRKYATPQGKSGARVKKGFTPEGVTLTETDEGTIQTLLSRVTTAMNYYVSVPTPFVEAAGRGYPVTPRHTSLRTRLEDFLIDKIQNASTQGQRITYYRAFLNIASTEKARGILKEILNAAKPPLTLKTKDKFDIVTRLAILGDPDAPKLLAGLEKTETSDDAKRYAYATHAAFATAENKAKFWTDFINNKNISESWIEAAAGPFNSIEHPELTLPYLKKALAELPKQKRERKIFFVNDWLADFIGGQRDEKALVIVNKFLADNPTLDTDLRLKILENSDILERAVKIRTKFPN